MDFSANLLQFNANLLRVVAPLNHTGNIVFSPFGLFTTIATLLLGCNNKKGTQDTLKTALTLATNTSDDALDSYVKKLMRSCHGNAASHTLLVSNTLHLTHEDEILLMNTVFFKSQWLRSFKPTSQTFHFKNGTKREIPFMWLEHTSFRAYPKSDWDIPATVKVVEIPSKDNISLFVFLSDNQPTLKKIIRVGSIADFVENFDEDSFDGIELKLPNFSFTHTICSDAIIHALDKNELLEDSVDLSNINGHGEIKMSSAKHLISIKIDEKGANVAGTNGMQNVGWIPPSRPDEKGANVAGTNGMQNVEWILPPRPDIKGNNFAGTNRKKKVDHRPLPRGSFPHLEKPLSQRSASYNIIPTEISVNEPFLFIIYDRKSKAPLFVGKVDDPSSP